MADPEGRGTHHTTPTPDPHRWILQGLGIVTVAGLAVYDLITPTDHIDREIYLIIGGIAIGARPETLVTLYTLRKGKTE